MDQAKVKTIQDWPEPRKVRDIQSFLGFANFYQRFIFNYSNIVVVLTCLTCKGIPFQFDIGKLHCTVRTVYRMGTVYPSNATKWAIFWLALARIHCICPKQFTRTGSDPIYTDSGTKLIMDTKKPELESGF